MNATPTERRVLTKSVLGAPVPTPEPVGESTPEPTPEPTPGPAAD